LLERIDKFFNLEDVVDADRGCTAAVLTCLEWMHRLRKNVKENQEGSRLENGH